MNKETLDTAKQEFEEILLSTKRDGMDRLIEYLRKSDMYTAPASSRYHSNYAGGLLVHSLNVYSALKNKKTDSTWKEALADIPDESIAISALLHDICKTNYYVPTWKNEKVYNPAGSKSDPGGRFDWQTVQGWTVDDKIPYGHGEKSVMMIEQFIRLTTDERYAIRWHMGFSEPKEQYGNLSAVFTRYPLSMALHMADLEATYLMESRGE